MRGLSVLFFGLGLTLSPASFAIVSQTQAPADSPLTRSTVLLTFGDTNRCTGAVVAPRLVLTAAHCMSYPVAGYRIVFSADITATLQGREKPEIRRIVDVYRPPTLFKVDPLSDDLALVELNKDVPDGVTAVALPDTELEVSPGAEITSYGFGLQNKEGVFLPMLPNSADPRIPWEPVQLRMKNLTVSQPKVSNFKGIDFTYHRLFVEQPDGGICLGDSGGPVFLQRANQAPLLIGVNGATTPSFNVRPAEAVPATPSDSDSNEQEPTCAAGAYVTRADTSIAWIRETIAAHGGAK